jgi:1-deoxy-D-xylulose-5-phosphate synthase
MLREEEVEAAHYDVRFLKPLDETMLHEVFKNFKNIITVEDGVIAGGFGSAVLEFMADHRYSATVVRLGIPDRFVEHGDRNLLIHELGYDAQAIAAAARKLTAAFSPLHH